MDRARLKLLAFTAELQEFEPRQIMMRQGQAGDVAFVILQGSTDIILEASTGNRTIATRGDHKLLGELALITNTPPNCNSASAGTGASTANQPDCLLHLAEGKPGGQHQSGAHSGRTAWRALAQPEWRLTSRRCASCDAPCSMLCAIQ